MYKTDTERAEHGSFFLSASSSFFYALYKTYLWNF